MEIFGWHGGWGDFLQIDSRQLGTGEGHSQGLGFYCAENRSGGEYFARHAYRTRPTAFLHKVHISIPIQRLWIDPSKNDVLIPNSANYSQADYLSDQRTLGMKIAAMRLKSFGVQSIMMYESDQPSHGWTCIVLDPSTVSVIKSFEYQSNGRTSAWLEISDL